MFLPICVFWLSLAPSVPRAPMTEVGIEVEIELLFEQNTTDGDAEVVLRVDSNEAFDRFVLLAPWPPRPVLALASRDREDLGLAELLVESAEPNIDAVKDAYPEGTYRALLRTTSRRWISAFAVLSHALPAAPVITHPLPGETIPVNGAVVTWQPDPTVASWVVEIEQDDLGISLSVLLPGHATSFAIPNDLLISGVEFELGLAAESELGNINVVETAFEVE